MDAEHFDRIARDLTRSSSRRTVLALALGGIVASLGLSDAAATNHRKRKRRRRQQQQPQCPTCGLCGSCDQGRCLPVANGTPCGDCQTCQVGQCLSTCQGGTTCQAGTCTCPSGTKACAGTCISSDQCCGACPPDDVCCTNVGECKNVRDDPAFCGHCANAQCPSGSVCANGACGLTCTTVGDPTPCFGTTCFCGNRVNPKHTGQHVCAEISPASCDTVTACTTDAECAPATLGFGQV